MVHHNFNYVFVPLRSFDSVLSVHGITHTTLKNKHSAFLTSSFSIHWAYMHPFIYFPLNFSFSISFCVFPVCIPMLSITPLSTCLVFVSQFSLLQVFLSTFGSFNSRVKVWSPAASPFPYRALWCWAHSASATNSSPQTLLQSTAALTRGWGPVKLACTSSNTVCRDVDVGQDAQLPFVPNNDFSLFFLLYGETCFAMN